MTGRWHRHPTGWMNPAGDVFAERGARMSGGGTAWLVWLRGRLEDDR